MRTRPFFLALRERSIDDMCHAALRKAEQRPDRFVGRRELQDSYLPIFSGWITNHTEEDGTPSLTADLPQIIGDAAEDLAYYHVVTKQLGPLDQGAESFSSLADFRSHVSKLRKIAENGWPQIIDTGPKRDFRSTNFRRSRKPFHAELF